MKLLLDFFPIVLFFVAFKFGDIYVATGVAIAATVIQIAYLRYAKGKVEPMQWLSLAIIVLFGGATMVLHDPTFIKWKPSILYWSFSVILLFGQVVLKRSLLKSAMGEQLQLPEPAWSMLTWSWIGFLALMGAVNLWVAMHYSEATWVNFKVFGIFGMLGVFVLLQALYMSRYIKEPEEAEAGKS
jgi:intracellular septation protein